MQQRSAIRKAVRATPRFDKALLAVARHPGKSNNALAIEAGVSFQTVARARTALGLAPSRAMGKRSKATPQDADAAEFWPRERLIAMDERFRQRMQRAIARGLERSPPGDASSERAA